MLNACITTPKSSLWLPLPELSNKLSKLAYKSRKKSDLSKHRGSAKCIPESCVAMNQPRAIWTEAGAGFHIALFILTAFMMPQKLPVKYLFSS